MSKTVINQSIDQSINRSINQSINSCPNSCADSHKPFGHFVYISVVHDPNITGIEEAEFRPFWPFDDTHIGISVRATVVMV